MTDSDIPVITMTSTVMSGTVVRWHRSLSAAENVSPVLSASRDGVMIHGDQFLARIPQEWVDAANQAHRDLAAGRDVRDLATHSHRGFMGPLEPVAHAPKPGPAAA